MPEESYSKLFSSITTSTIWAEPDHVRIVWITMLAMSDRFGYVGSSVPGLAQMARVSVDKTRQALACFLAPDPDSRTKDHDGRRIEVADRGWQILNYTAFRKRLDAEAAKERKRQWWRENRGSGANPDGNDPPALDAELDAPTDSRHITDASSPTSTSKAKKKKHVAPTALDSDFDAFWSIYPRKTAKANASKAWAKHKPDLPAVLAGLQAQLAAGMFAETKFTPHGATYLNQRRWEDPPERQEAPPAAQGRGPPVNPNGASPRVSAETERQHRDASLDQLRRDDPETYQRLTGKDPAHDPRTH